MRTCFSFLLMSIMVVCNSQAQSIIRTIAGNGHLGGALSGDGGPAYNTAIAGPFGICVDRKGNVYYTDDYNKRVKRISKDGILSLFAGSGLPSSATSPGGSGDGGPATAARLVPQSIAVDSIGNVYIADIGVATVRKVDTFGIITTVVGNASILTIGGGGPATAIGLGNVGGLAFDAAGHLYVSNANNTVFRVDSAGYATVVVGGSGLVGYSGDGGPATAASSSALTDITFDPAGNMYVIDAGNYVIRKVDTAGLIWRFAGMVGNAGTTGDGGQATDAKLSNVTGISADKNGNIYIADGNKIRVVNTSGIISTYAGANTRGYAGDGAAPSASTRFGRLNRIALDDRGYMYIADYGSGAADTPYYGRRIRQVFRQDSFGISVAPSTALCSGTSATFTAVPHNAYYSHVYQWYLNGVPVGTNSSVFSSSAINDNDVVMCTILDTASGGMVLATTDTLVMTVGGPIVPAVAITASDDTVCLGAPLILTATATAGGTAPVYNWYVHDTLVYSGAVFVYAPVSSATVKCVLASSYGCAVPATDTALQAIGVLPGSHPTITVNVLPDTVVNPGQMITMYCNITYGGTAPMLQWYKNGVAIAGATTQVYAEVAGVPATYYCVLHSNAYCAVPATDTSATISMHISTVSVVGSESNGNSFSLYPNPGSGIFTVAGTDNSNTGSTTITVRNVLGQVVYCEAVAVQGGRFTHQVAPGNNVPAGVYSLQVGSGGNNMATLVVLR